MDTFPDFSNYGYQVIRELGNNRAGGRVTYQATEINTSNTVCIKYFQFARSNASWSEYSAYEREIQVLKQPSKPDVVMPVVFGFSGFVSTCILPAPENNRCSETRFL